MQEVLVIATFTAMFLLQAIYIVNYNAFNNLDTDLGMLLVFLGSLIPGFIFVAMIERSISKKVRRKKLVDERYNDIIKQDERDRRWNDILKQVSESSPDTQAHFTSLFPDEEIPLSSCTFVPIEKSYNSTIF